jgi:HEAT repeat protein
VELLGPWKGSQRLGDKNSASVIFTPRSVRRLRASRDYEGLVTLLQDGSRRERRAAARALGTLGDVRAVNPLADALGSAYGQDEGLPGIIVSALGELQDRAAIEPLTRLLHNRTDDGFYFAAHRAALFPLAALGEYDLLEGPAEDETRDAAIRGEADGLLPRRHEQSSE